MILTVIKRDGLKVPFDQNRIKLAIEAAMKNTKKGVDEELADNIATGIGSRGSGERSVEDIQDSVEKALMKSSRKDVAKEYIQYRHRRDVARKSKTYDMFSEIVAAKENEVTRENANMNSDSPAGQMMKFASETTKPFVDDYLLSEDVREAVDGNYMHIHDKDYYPTKSLTCLQHPLDIIFKKGFRAGHGELRPPKRIETAATQACVSMETVQNEMHGGQAIPAFDFYLAPFVRSCYEEELDRIAELLSDIPDPKFWDELKGAEIEDYIKKDLPQICAVPAAGRFITYPGKERIKQEAINRTVDRVHQAMEAFVHNMNNIHSRGGNQVVFSSINYGTDTSAEGRCIIREILKATEAGVGNGATAIFPIQIWKLKAGVSYLPGDPNYDLYKYACKVTARRFFPNFLNLDASYNRSPEWNACDEKRYIHEVAVMGCRTRLWSDKFGPSTSVGRGNLSFTTVNLPKLALEAAIEAGVYKKAENGEWIRSENATEDRVNNAVQCFYEKLENYLDLTAKQLDERYKFQATAKAKQFPLLMSGLWVGSEKLGPEDSVEPVIKHGTLGVGFIGLAEALVALTGKHHGESKESQNLGLNIVSFIDKRCKDYSKEYDHNYSCFATPAEGLSGKFTRKDQKEFGKVKGVTDREYYTNSSHVPVYYPISFKEKIEIEGPYHKYEPAGHIAYVEVDGSVVKNPEAIMDIVDLMVKNDIGYGSINFNCSRCEDCGYESSDEFKDGVCPKCGSTRTTYLQRITGYLVGTTNRWNGGKKAELRDRVTHVGHRDTNVEMIYGHNNSENS